FLTPDEHQSLLAFVGSRSGFRAAHIDQPNGVSDTADESFRKASVATPDPDIAAMFESRLQAILPHARRETEVGYFRLGKLERQLTAHGDGDFFRMHSDLGAAWQDSSSRRLSYVYYFHEQPRRFEGGELRIYDNRISDSGLLEAAETFQTIEPKDNSIVFFPSDALHEVRPVHVPGECDVPGATRFTLTGWFHDADHRKAAPPMEREVRTALTQRYTPSFTDNGFIKMKTPSAVHRVLRAAYNDRREQHFSEIADETHMPTGTPDFIDIEDIKGQFHLALQSIHEDWSGQELKPTAIYGLRVYRNGQTLLPHTDTLETHVISSIVHIAHDTAEPWPLWITDLLGNEHEIVLEEGEMLLYESARCPHARPQPLNGSAYCSLFVHYQPVDWDVDYWTLIDKARADGATDVLPEQLWPDLE
ncbi:MAG: 2OG-Fe(II) oxygenase, partial [Ilumatobacter sp.]|nr:2OG-Fe(II) oxygenase [Ilumatobacter sp.]